MLTDGAAGSLFAAGEVDAVLIGADRISGRRLGGQQGRQLPAGGARPLHHGVPFVVVAPTTTVDLASADGAAIEVEQRPGREVTEFALPFGHGPGAEGGGGRMVPAGAEAYNPAFDVTPPELVTAIVTERGVVSPVNREGIAGLCSIHDRRSHDQVMG